MRFAHHQALVEDPERVLNEVIDSLGLAPMSMEGLLRIDTRRNRRRQALLARREKAELEEFIEAQGERIRSLERRGIVDPGASGEGDRA